MDSTRQRTFQKLRPPCVELSSVALRFRAHQTPVKEVQQALEAVHQVVASLGREDVLDEKLAEYAFFPLSHVFNETQRVSERCLELAVLSLGVLIQHGWRQRLAPEMGKQLLILLTLLAGGNPAQKQRRPRSEELAVAAFDCMSVLFSNLGRSDRGKVVFNEVGTATITDQTVYILLEGVTDSASDAVQFAAVKALQSLYHLIQRRTVLASLLPRTVSTLTKALRLTTEVRRTHKVLEACLQVLRQVLRNVLNDLDALAPLGPLQGAQMADTNDSEILDESWLKATASQVKLALAHVIQLRDHDKADVKQALQQLCLMVIDECSRSLADSIPMMVETLLVLAHGDETRSQNTAFSALSHLATSNELVSDLLRSSLHSWTSSLPRVMHGNDDRQKQRALRKISTAFEILSSAYQGSDVLDKSMAVALCDSVSAAVHVSPSKIAQPQIEAPVAGFELMSLQNDEKQTDLGPILMSHRSQEESVSELKTLIKRLNRSDSPRVMAQAVLSRLHVSEGDDLLAAYWLALNFLDHTEGSPMDIDSFLIDDQASSVLPNLISELYSYSLPLLLELPSANPPDWRLPALALESLTLQANQLRADFRPELIDALYPVLQLLGSHIPPLRSHAMTTLNKLATSCEYPSTGAMLIDNVDYLVNAVALNLNTFDISPQAPQVLLMMVRLCGATLIPYLDDLIASVFAALDSFHGYPKLVELLFSALSAIVDEGARNSTLTITEGSEPIGHKKRRRTVEEMLQEVEERRAKEKDIIEIDQDEVEDKITAPHRPWSSKLDGQQASSKDGEDEDDQFLAEEGGLPPEPPEKPLSKAHALLLSIASSTPPHLSSPFPPLRAQLLRLLTRASIPLSRHENSFLPLIHDIWPAVIARLHDTELYIVVAATETVSALCVGAGDFMAMRVEDEFKNWKNLYQQFFSKVQDENQRRMRNRDRAMAKAAEVGKEILLPQIAKSNSPDFQVWDAMVRMWGTIMAYVRVTDDMGEQILQMVAPVIDEPGKEAVKEALAVWNEEKVRQAKEKKTGNGVQQVSPARPQTRLLNCKKPDPVLEKVKLTLGGDSGTLARTRIEEVD